jgi:hypothetical protein
MLVFVREPETGRLPDQARVAFLKRRRLEIVRRRFSHQEAEPVNGGST